MPRTPSFSPDMLEAALAGLEGQRQQIEEQIATVRRMLRRGIGRIAAVTGRIGSTAQPPRKRTMSAAARKRIAAAQKKRWAEFRKKQRTTKKTANK